MTIEKWPTSQHDLNYTDTVLPVDLHVSHKAIRGSISSNYALEAVFSDDVCLGAPQESGEDHREDTEGTGGWIGRARIILRIHGNKPFSRPT